MEKELITVLHKHSRIQELEPFPLSLQIKTDSNRMNYFVVNASAQ